MTAEVVITRPSGDRDVIPVSDAEFRAFLWWARGRFGGDGLAWQLTEEQVVEVRRWLDA